MIARVRQAIVMLLVGVAAASAQSTTGSISGTVRDQSKAILPGATVEVRNVDTGAVRSMVTDHEGRYRALTLPPGPYSLVAELSASRRQPSATSSCRSAATCPSI